jgi:hypothetical protein
VEPGLLATLPECWPGWEIESWGDRYEEHMARCNGAVLVPDLDPNAALDEVESWLRKRIFQRFEDCPAGQVLELAQMLAPVAPGMVVSDCAVEGSPTRPTPDEWAAVERAFAQMRAELQV